MSEEKDSGQETSGLAAHTAETEKAIARVPWACPKCGQDNDGCGPDERENCTAAHGCSGFVCECSDEGGDTHGETYGNPCMEARCYHCGWAGVFPAPPRGLEAWEKKALAKGWQPPAGWDKGALASRKAFLEAGPKAR